MKEKIIELLGFPGKMISGSKSGYHKRYPNNLIVFNSNLIVMIDRPIKLWYGDLDLTISLDKLKEVAEAIGQDIIVLRETDARFENENSPRIENFVLRITKDGLFELGEFEKKYYIHNTLIKK